MGAVPLMFVAAARFSICTFFQRFLFILAIWMDPLLRTVSGGAVLPQKPFVFHPRVQWPRLNFLLQSTS